MQLVLKDEKYTFTVTKAAEPKTEFGGTQQKMNRASKLPVVRRAGLPALRRCDAAAGPGPRPGR
jgi:hypothetical protein